MKIKKSTFIEAPIESVWGPVHDIGQAMAGGGGLDISISEPPSHLCCGDRNAYFDYQSSPVEGGTFLEIEIKTPLIMAWSASRHIDEQLVDVKAKAEQVEAASVGSIQE